jgi:glycogen synthase
MPSLGENFPYVALESLACGTPVASFRVGGLVEILGVDERGVFARPFDADDLAAGSMPSCRTGRTAPREARGVASGSSASATPSGGSRRISRSIER